MWRLFPCIPNLEVLIFVFFVFFGGGWRGGRAGGKKVSWDGGEFLSGDFSSHVPIYNYSGNSIKQTPLAKKKCPLYRDAHFIEIFSKIVWPQSKAIRSSLYCLSYRGVRFIVCPLYRDSTVLTWSDLEISTPIIIL